MDGFDSTIALVPLASRRKTTNHVFSKGYRRLEDDEDIVAFTHDAGPRSSKSPTGGSKSRSHVRWKAFTRRLDAWTSWAPQGWRFGAYMAVALSILTLTVNISVAIVSYNIIRGKGFQEYIAPIHTGSCTEIRRMSTWIHLAINVLSTLILGASNYSMQCISAPTRKEIDRAHERGIWLHIGVHSIRNLRFTSYRKLFIWILLGLSSVPLHLLYNSTFFTSTVTNSYEIYVAADDFARGAPFDSTVFPSANSTTNKIGIRMSNGSTTELLNKPAYLTDPSKVQSALMDGDKGLFEFLSPEDCISSYAKMILPERRNLVLVVKNSPRDKIPFAEPWSSYGEMLSGATSYDWIMAGSESNVTCNSQAPYDAGIFTSIFRLVSCKNSSLYAITSYDQDVTEELTGTDNWFVWICSQSSYSSGDSPICSDGAWRQQLNADPWKVYGFEVDYCLSEKVQDQCFLNVGISLLIVVIVFNFVKLILFVIIATTLNDQPLITIGDAAASFIRDTDESTAGMCLFDKNDIILKDKLYGTPEDGGVPTQWRFAKPFPSEPKRLRSAASQGRWVTTLTLTVLAIIPILILLAYGITALDYRFGKGSPKALWALGLGTVSPYTLISGLRGGSGGGALSGDGAVVRTVVLANLPQLVLSLLYFALNGLVTSMCVALEWAHFAQQHEQHQQQQPPRARGLRVSSPAPRSQQRATYFLQVPYRAAAPLLLGAALLHWLASQSVFFAQLAGRDAVGAPVAPQRFGGGSGSGSDSSGGSGSGGAVLTTLAFSPLGMVLTAVVAALGLGAAAALGARRLAPGMPLAASCSAAIAAACHGPAGTSELLALRWGVVRPGGAGEGGEEGEEGVVGHCAFSNGEVGRPVAGRLYA